MAKRRHKLEPITVDEITASPSLEGYDAFLRFRPAEDTTGGASPIDNVPAGDFPSPARDSSPTGNLPTGKAQLLISPIGVQPSGYSPIDDLPSGKSLSGLLPISELPVGDAAVFSLPGRRQKVHRAQSTRDGHSHGENQLYEAFWIHGTPEGPETRMITIGYGGMQELCRLDKTNCKKNILSLIEKRAIEIVTRFDVRRNIGNTYRVFSPEAVFRRRQQAGLEFVIRTSGVRFVPHP
jgi:hypothetical protein